MLQRRTLLAGLGAALAAPALTTPSLAASKAMRRFRILRDGDDIGTHDLDAVLGPNGFEIVITIRIAVKVLGITAYRYELDNREVWQGGTVASVNTKINDDGTDDFCKIVRQGEALQIDGSRHTGQVSPEAVTTSYYASPFIKRRPWISTQTGAPLKVQIVPEGRANWWAISGDLETKLGYAGGEWQFCEFDAGGEPAAYEIISQTGKIGALWAQA